MNKLSKDEIKFIAEELAKEIDNAGGLERFYDQMYGDGAFKKDSDRYMAGFVDSNDTMH